MRYEFDGLSGGRVIVHSSGPLSSPGTVSAEDVGRCGVPHAEPAYRTDLMVEILRLAERVRELEGQIADLDRFNTERAARISVLMADNRMLMRDSGLLADRVQERDEALEIGRAMDRHNAAHIATLRRQLDEAAATLRAALDEQGRLRMELQRLRVRDLDICGSLSPAGRCCALAPGHDGMHEDGEVGWQGFE